MLEFIFSINLSLCSGCLACMVACKQENDLGPGVNEEPGSQGPKWIKPHHYFSPPANEKTDRFVFIPLMCNHCQNAPCVRGCPTGATHFGEKGLVCFDEEKCIGCKYCVEVCPYQIRSFDPIKKVSSKCQLCLPRLREGKKPRCVETCPQGARNFQWIADKEDTEKGEQTEATFSLLGDTGTEPSVVYRVRVHSHGERRG